jgi:hypothetical protein
MAQIPRKAQFQVWIDVDVAEKFRAMAKSCGMTHSQLFASLVQAVRVPALETAADRVDLDTLEAFNARRKSNGATTR